VLSFLKSGRHGGVDLYRLPWLKRRDVLDQEPPIYQNDFCVIEVRILGQSTNPDRENAIRP
jgi:hypothetical protein